MKIYFAGYKYQIIIAYAFVIMLRTLKEQPNDNFTPSNHLSHLFTVYALVFSNMVSISRRHLYTEFENPDSVVALALIHCLLWAVCIDFSIG